MPPAEQKSGRMLERRGHRANPMVASALREAAALLQAQDASQFRILAYLKAARTVEELEEDIADIASKGLAALDALPNIGSGIAAAVLELLSTGRWSQLDRLRGGLDPEDAFRHVPGIGPELAQLIHEHLHVDTLVALEAAAHDGRLERVPGIGPRRAAIIRNGLAALLSRRGTGGFSRRMEAPPPVGMVLDVDREYRTRAQAGDLRKIAPKRFNPEGAAWLPILHTERGPWHFTALFSNTARAHELKRTTDWVVIFFARDNQPEGQCTVVSETSGPMKGRRIVRGRERECAELAQFGE
jgi:DNA uptake protein ComE-like DNA-binding protein